MSSTGAQAVLRGPFVVITDLPRVWTCDRAEKRPASRQGCCGAASAVTGSPVRVGEVADEHVVLNVPDSVHDADRVIPQDLIEFGQTAGNWFCWDLEQKQPRAPFNDGYAGTVKWGRDSVLWDNRVGGRFGDVMEALNGTVIGHVDPAWY